MNHKKSNLYSKNGQRGITLLLAVMIMSTMVLIVSVVSYLAVQEFRTSRAQFNNEPALGASHSGTENALWGLKRPSNTAVPPCDTGKSNIAITPGITSVGNYCLSYNGASLTVSPGSDFVFYLYDTKNPNGDTDLLSCQGTSGPETCYNTLLLTYQTGIAGIQVSVSRLDGTSVGTASVNQSSVSGTIPNLSGPSGSDNRMKVSIAYQGSSGSATVFVNTDKGLPDFPTIDSTGCAGRIMPNNDCTSSGEVFTRRLQVTVPSSGIAP